MLASVCWGLAYALIGKMMHSGLNATFVLSVTGVAALTTYMIFLLKSGGLGNSLNIIDQNKWLLVCLIGAAICLISGQFLVYKAITLKDAPHVAILEISYPLFTCLFTWLLFRNLELSWNMVVGGAFIFIGSAMVLFKSGS
jgi:drug/metabolite transporter (DMT)-like permease